jgi:hypothetical protein
MTDEGKDGCALDFSADVTKPEDVEELLIPKGDEEDEDDD